MTYYEAMEDLLENIKEDYELVPHAKYAAIEKTLDMIMEDYEGVTKLINDLEKKINYEINAGNEVERIVKQSVFTEIGRLKIVQETLAIYLDPLYKLSTAENSLEKKD